jgi:hypothetical protein
MNQMMKRRKNRSERDGNQDETKRKKERKKLYLAYNEIH